MATVKDDPQAATALTITLDGLASGSSRQSAAYDNSTNLYVDVLIGTTVVTPATGTLSATVPEVTVYVAALMDGTHYTDGCSGANSAFTPPGSVNSPYSNVLVGVASQVLSSALTVYSMPFSVASLFGGKLPTKFCVWATNSLGVALGTGNAITVTPSWYQAA